MWRTHDNILKGQSIFTLLRCESEYLWNRSTGFSPTTRGRPHVTFSCKAENKTRRQVHTFNPPVCRSTQQPTTCLERWGHALSHVQPGQATGAKTGPGQEGKLLILQCTSRGCRRGEMRHAAHSRGVLAGFRARCHHGKQEAAARAQRWGWREKKKRGRKEP